MINGNKLNNYHPMTDYKGNEILLGMEVCYIMILDRQYFRYGVFIHKEEGGWDQSWEDKRPDRPCWEVGKYYKVEDSVGYLCIKIISDGYTFYQSLESAFEDDTTILAIKGISDTEEDYLEFLNQ